MKNKPITILEEQVHPVQLNTESKRKVGILGGTFNPPHIGHLIIADQVKNQLDLDEVLFIPGSTPPHADKKETIEAKHRVEMVKRATEEIPYFSVDMIEINRGGVSYTYDTIIDLKKRDPDVAYYFIIGADMVMDLPNWHKIDELIQLVQFVGVNRPGYEQHAPYPVIWVDVPGIQVSSTQIRQKIADHCSVQFLVPEEVLSYIAEERLYQDEQPSA